MDYGGSGCMYLVSIYFDENTNKIIKQHISQIAQKCGNTYMLDGNVPPHITISAFQSENEAQVIEMLDKSLRNIKSGSLQWATVGMFLPYVIYTAPVLNEYLYNLSVQVFESIKAADGIVISKYYRPLQWIPHTTLAKKLSRDEMAKAFECLQNSFGVFSGKAVRIGLAKTNPYEDIVSWRCEK